MSQRSRRRKYEARDPWWMLEYGGAPVWMILTIAAVLGTVLAVALLSRG